VDSANAAGVTVIISRAVHAPFDASLPSVEKEKRPAAAANSFDAVSAPEIGHSSRAVLRQVVAALCSPRSWQSWSSWESFAAPCDEPENNKAIATAAKRRGAAVSLNGATMHSACFLVHLELHARLGVFRWCAVDYW